MVIKSQLKQKNYPPALFKLSVLKINQGILLKGATMKIKCIAQLILIILFFFGLLFSASAKTIYVDINAAGSEDGTSWHNAMTDLQQALESSVPGDEIWVAEGVYIPSKRIDESDARTAAFQMKNGVILYGGFDPSLLDDTFEERDWAENIVTLSGDIGIENDSSDNCYHVFYHPEELDLNQSAVLDGVTITGGKTTDTFPHLQGGGMYNNTASPRIVNCTFKQNYGRQGGGIYNVYSSPAIINCFFKNNDGSNGGGIYNLYSGATTIISCNFENNSTYGGGGIYNNDSDSVVVSESTFKNNSANSGGGVYNTDSSPQFINCTFESNSAVYGSGYGGGMYNYSSKPLVKNCIFKNNTSNGHGGGMGNVTISSPNISGCKFEDNSAVKDGGGIYITGGGGIKPVIRNCVFTRNSADNGGGLYNNNGGSGPIISSSFIENTAAIGGAAYNPSLMISCIVAGNTASSVGAGVLNNNNSPDIINCTFWNNRAGENGGGIMNTLYSDATITNTIVWNNTPNQIARSLDSFPEVSYCNIQGGYGENMDLDPLFADPLNYDFHLSTDSPCIEAGDNEAAASIQYDFEMDGRIVDKDNNNLAVVDIGADEVCPVGLCESDFNCDQDIDGIDLTAFSEAFGSQDGDENYNPRCDLNQDNIVDSSDLVLFSSDFGNTS